MTNQTQRSPSLACCARLIEKAQYPAFLKAIEYCEGMIDGAIETTAIQRAFGFTYETEKAFQTAVKMNVVETVPPSENLLKDKSQTNAEKHVRADRRATETSGRRRIPSWRECHCAMQKTPDPITG